MLFSTLLLQLLVQVIGSCPNYCDCDNGVVNCANNDLESVPPDIPPATRILNLRNNKLQFLAESSFLGLHNLQEIHLQNNIITNVHENTFRNSVKLKLLNLKHNNLLSLSEGLFTNNNRLKQIDVRDNPQLIYIPYKLVEHLQSLYSLQANNVDCGCDMLEWYTSFPERGIRFDIRVDVICDTPTEYKGQILSSLVFEECTTSDTICNNGGIACDEGAVCITEDLWCDGNFDCHDGYDEISCATEDSETRCESEADSFLCGDGMCIPDLWVCDNHVDCRDSSDEINCSETEVLECYNEDYRCSNGRCISHTERCDGNNDCGDWSDEAKLLCGELNAVNICPGGMVLCSLEGGCISHTQQCDGVRDCTNGTDELNCFDNCTSYCESDKRCIPDSWVCDAVPDCLDRSDESNCEYTCAEDEVKCGGCLSCQFLCDGFMDCQDERDESACTICNGSTCPGSETKRSLTMIIVMTVSTASVCIFIGSLVLCFVLFIRKRKSGDQEPPHYTEIEREYLRENIPHSPPPRYKSEPDITTSLVGLQPSFNQSQDI